MPFILSRINAFCMETKLGLEEGGIVFRFRAGKEILTLFDLTMSSLNTNTNPFSMCKGSSSFWLKQQRHGADHSLSSGYCV